MKRAAYFVLSGDYFGRPFDDTVVLALLDAGFDVDYFSPGDLTQDVYPPSVQRKSVEYRSRALTRKAVPFRHRDYDLFLGTADLPMAMAGVLGASNFRPTVALADEIYIGGYEGSARGYWRNLAKSGMHRARFTITTDQARIPLQRQYASLPADHQFEIVSSCYSESPPMVDRTALRSRLGIPENAFVLAATGRFAADTGAPWAIRLLEQTDESVHLMIQTGGPPDGLTDALLRNLTQSGRVTYLPERLGWRESMCLSAAADAGLVFYLSPKPQFQAMGISSSKLCTALWLGQPVVATRQDSFQFIEDRHCGVLIGDESELREALAKIRNDYESYASGAGASVREFIRPRERRERLAEIFSKVR